MKVGFLITNLFLEIDDKSLPNPFSLDSWVIIATEAVLFFLSGIWIKFLIDILLLENAFVIEDKTPGWSLTSILK